MQRRPALLVGGFQMCCSRDQVLHGHIAQRHDPLVTAACCCMMQGGVARLHSMFCLGQGGFANPWDDESDWSSLSAVRLLCLMYQVLCNSDEALGEVIPPNEVFCQFMHSVVHQQKLGFDTYMLPASGMHSPCLRECACAQLCACFMLLGSGRS